MRLGIIGTAGRGEDGKKLTAAYWRSMNTIAQVVTCMSGADHLVSGGSAWSDHLAVVLFLNGHASNLTLHLPCLFHEVPGTWAFERSHECGIRLNQLHARFQQVTGVNPFDQIGTAIAKGARVDYSHHGFKERNTAVAMESEQLLAFTFGEGGIVADGGTKDTVDKFLARRGGWSPGPTEMHEPDAGPLFAAQVYHFSLSTRTLHTL